MLRGVAIDKAGQYHDRRERTSQTPSSWLNADRLGWAGLESREMDLTYGMVYSGYDNIGAMMLHIVSRRVRRH